MSLHANSNTKCLCNEPTHLQGNLWLSEVRGWERAECSWSVCFTAEVPKITRPPRIPRTKKASAQLKDKQQTKVYMFYILPELSPKNLKPRGHAAGAAVICIAAASLYRADGPSKQHSCHHKANYGDEDAEEDEDELSTGDSSRSGISRHYRLRKKHKDLRKAKKSVPERSCQLRAACVRAASDSSVHESLCSRIRASSSRLTAASNPHRVKPECYRNRQDFKAKQCQNVQGCESQGILLG